MKYRLSLTIIIIIPAEMTIQGSITEYNAFLAKFTEVLLNFSIGLTLSSLFKINFSFLFFFQIK